MFHAFALTQNVLEPIIPGNLTAWPFEAYLPHTPAPYLDGLEGPPSGDASGDRRGEARNALEGGEPPPPGGRGELWSPKPEKIAVKLP